MHIYLIHFIMKDGVNDNGENDKTHIIRCADVKICKVVSRFNGIWVVRYIKECTKLKSVL